MLHVLTCYRLLWKFFYKVCNIKTQMEPSPNSWLSGQYEVFWAKTLIWRFLDRNTGFVGCYPTLRCWHLLNAWHCTRIDNKVYQVDMMNGVVSGHNKMLHVWNGIVLEMQVRNKILYISTDWGKEDGTIDSLRGHNEGTIPFSFIKKIHCFVRLRRGQYKSGKVARVPKNGKWPLAGDKWCDCRMSFLGKTIFPTSLFGVGKIIIRASVIGFGYAT